MGPADHVASVRRDADAFTAAVTAVDLAAPVPSCDGWVVRDLVDHVTGVYTFWLGTLRRAVREGSLEPGPRVPRGSGPVSIDRFAEVATGLHDELAAAPAETPVWNWSGRGQTAAWVARRMAHETAVHRVDAELAAGNGDAPEIAAALAADGIDEVFDTFLPAMVDELTEEGLSGLDLRGSLLIRPGDASAAWFVDIPGTATPTVRRAARGDSADCLASGNSSELLLLLWNRIDRRDRRLTVSGDAGVLDRWRKLPIFD
jgi:uncharacterized protein (TIGR03083 family)